MSVNFKELGEKVDSLFSSPATLTVQEQLSGFEDVKKEVLAIKEADIVTLEDKEMVDELLKRQINLGMAVLERAAQNVKVGSPATYLEAYANINDSITNSIKEFIHFKKMIHDIQIIHNPSLAAPSSVNNNTLNIFDSKGLLEHMNKVRDEAEIHKIVPKFRTESSVEEGSSKFDPEPREVTESNTRVPPNV